MSPFIVAGGGFAAGLAFAVVLAVRRRVVDDGETVIQAARGVAKSAWVALGGGGKGEEE